MVTSWALTVATRATKAKRTANQFSAAVAQCNLTLPELFPYLQCLFYKKLITHSWMILNELIYFPSLFRVDRRICFHVTWDWSLEV